MRSICRLNGDVDGLQVEKSAVLFRFVLFVGLFSSLYLDAARLEARRFAGFLSSRHGMSGATLVRVLSLGELWPIDPFSVLDASEEKKRSQRRMDDRALFSVVESGGEGTDVTHPTLLPPRAQLAVQ